MTRTGFAIFVLTLCGIAPATAQTSTPEQVDNILSREQQRQDAVLESLRPKSNVFYPQQQTLPLEADADTQACFHIDRINLHGDTRCQNAGAGNSSPRSSVAV